MTPTARGKAGGACAARRRTALGAKPGQELGTPAQQLPLPREPHLGDDQIEPAGAWEEVGPLDPHAHEVAGARAVLQPPQVLRPDLA